VRGHPVLEAFLGLLAPRRCPGCDAISVVGGTALALTPSGIAERVRGGASLQDEQFCPACAPLLDAAPAAQLPPAACAAVFVFAGPLADAITRLKYGRRVDLAAPLGELLARAALAYAGRIDRLVPLPLHPARLRARGFNQSALLARPVARALGVRLDTSSLQRVRPTEGQAGLQRARRADNVRGAFLAHVRVPGQRVLLIDDVRTTGATLAEAERALLQAGCSEVHSLALAQAQA
jgi:ComF family protein